MCRNKRFYEIKEMKDVMTDKRTFFIQPVKNNNRMYDNFSGIKTQLFREIVTQLIVY